MFKLNTMYQYKFMIPSQTLLRIFELQGVFFKKKFNGMLQVSIKGHLILIFRVLVVKNLTFNYFLP